MFAVLKTGGKQYKVASGDILRVERLAAEAGDTVQFNDVLMVGSKIGTPFVEGAGVQAEVIDQIKADKVIHFVKRRRKNSSKRTVGHRQKLTLVRITEILAEGAQASGVTAAIGSGAAGVTGAMRDAAKAQTAKTKATKTKAAKTKTAEKKSGSHPIAAALDTVASVLDTVAGAAEKVAVVAEKPSNLLESARDGIADDLKKISGVGPKLEAKLNENGIFHFDQIAEWTENQIAYMDEQLSFKGRMARDNWIAQAKEFIKG